MAAGADRSWGRPGAVDDDEAGGGVEGVQDAAAGFELLEELDIGVLVGEVGV